MTEITTPVGRVVWGNLKGRPKVNQETKQPVLKDGKPVIQYSFGLAIPKDQFAPVWAVMVAEGSKIFPSIAAGQIPPSFAMKFVDGDGIDSEGKPFNTREGYRGCYVLAISTEAFEPPLTQLVGPGQYQNVPGDTLKTGHFVRVALDIQSHGQKPGVPTSKAGLYLNPRLVEWVAFGAEIFNGPDATAAFGGTAAALPAGASATPLSAPAPLPPGAPQNPPQMPPAGSPPGYPAPAPAVAYAPAAAPPMAPLAAPPMMPAAIPPGYPAPTAYPSSAPAPAVAPAPDFVAAALAAPPPPVAPPTAPATQQYQVPMDQPIPAGYRLLGYSPDGKNQIVTTP